jgi:hypothetical protein
MVKKLQPEKFNNVLCSFPSQFVHRNKTLSESSEPCWIRYNNAQNYGHTRGERHIKDI